MELVDHPTGPAPPDFVACRTPPTPSEPTTAPTRATSRCSERRAAVPAGRRADARISRRHLAPTPRADARGRSGTLPPFHPARRPCAGPLRLEVTVPVADDTRIAVIGLGYVGLPLAIAFAEAGLDVEGIDASPHRVAELNARRSPIDDITDERLSRALDGRPPRGPRRGRAPGEADAIFVCVPTPITETKDPDLGPVLSAAALIRRPPPGRPAHRPAVHHLPRHHQRPLPAGPRARAAWLRRGTSTSPLPRSA